MQAISVFMLDVLVIGHTQSACRRTVSVRFLMQSGRWSTGRPAALRSLTHPVCRRLAKWRMLSLNVSAKNVASRVCCSFGSSVEVTSVIGRSREVALLASHRPNLGAFQLVGSGSGPRHGETYQ